MVVFEREREREREREVIYSGKMSKETERARVCSLWVVERNNKKIEKNEYFIEISCKIEKVGFLYKIDRKFRRTDVDALKMINSN